MRRILVTSVFIALGFLTSSAMSFAQDQNELEETPQPDTEAEKPKPDEPKGERDLDRFFKEAEEQAQEGQTCTPPPEPIA